MPLHDVYATERDYQIAGRFVITAQGTNSPLVDIVLGDCFANHLHKRSNFPNDHGDGALQHYLASLNALPGVTWEPEGVLDVRKRQTEHIAETP